MANYTMQEENREIRHPHTNNVEWKKIYFLWKLPLQAGNNHYQNIYRHNPDKTPDRTQEDRPYKYRLNYGRKASKKEEEKWQEPAI